jgi:hypothetical protein
MIELRPETRKLLDELSNMTLFHNLGNVDETVYWKVESLEQAIEFIQDDFWVGLVHEEGNKIRDRIQEISWDRYNDWNKHCDLFWDELNLIIAKQLNPIGMSSEVKLQIRYELEGIYRFRLIEAQYNDIIKSEFFDSALNVYREGFLLCGWEGNQAPPVGRFGAF